MCVHNSMHMSENHALLPFTCWAHWEWGSIIWQSHISSLIRHISLSRPKKHTKPQILSNLLCLMLLGYSIAGLLCFPFSFFCCYKSVIRRRNLLHGYRRNGSNSFRSEGFLISPQIFQFFKESGVVFEVKSNNSSLWIFSTSCFVQYTFDVPLVPTFSFSSSFSPPQWSTHW